MQFARLRLIILTIALLAQMYLFLRARKAILCSRRPKHFKSGFVHVVGAAIGLLFLRNAYVLARPIAWVDPPMAARVTLFYLPAIWTLGSIFSALLLSVTQIAGGLVRMFVQSGREPARQHSAPPENPDRRRFLRAGVAGLATAPFVFSGYGAFYAGKAYDVPELALPFGLPLRVVQLTDIHAGVYMTREEIRRYVDAVTALRPDLFVITGDFISNSIAFLPGCLEEIIRVQARYGTFATLGNHERWYGRPNELQRTFRRYQIPLLVNAHQVIKAEQGSFAVAGIDDLRTGHADLEAALHGLDPAIPTLLLSHRPEIFPQAAARGIPLTLAGHWHGGQIKLSLPGAAISLAHLRTPYPEGLFRIDASRLYVSRGIGTTFTPVRLNAPPEVTLFHLT
ncbi:MAG TPA: metallophosphoesterase [Syntrophorhabdales bacterium]|nr:metallophosphoesterase [Syntrophorhabdales bacterium]